MVTVAVDLSLPEGSVAVGVNEELLSVVSWSIPKKHAERVFVEIDRCLEATNLSKRDVERVIVTSGPGSFTGVRLSVTVGKAFKCCGVPVFSTSTLKAMVAGFESLGFLVVPVIPGRRKRFYTLIGEELLDIGEEELLERLGRLGEPLVVYRGEIPQSIFKRFRCLKDLTPLAARLLSVPESQLEPLRFNYVRDHDAKPSCKRV
ncbi:tRNA (adenosine(37)-N6)-threonylcarbamoyltransferase complex dimerization subunit type 1 TsaB [Phorcysia thermohydrogeniphila]|uniref:tRNA threonylcarbamoyladenosine biosynthesis protein TsaB n=1 Tax=Phorcysia thermohydrogeniphila TaxID=936138 RepID=A0A4R1G646_9BACT|nr:tRNA (adenosine(37)-N6)-threonylcarbamoyltransferase complex dimerization subunit type 1 TsaB [Phorcysia thermohydrogeniphila]TCK03447.1 tRNA threonylcarbamoyladenosine biosynthesis protein TsaB [Phorcysia thermohydrogeniphila]